ncbi:50S ribosomal protein L10 [bacterium]|nr:50S ribosomal protein L10 [bacterium]
MHRETKKEIVQGLNATFHSVNTAFLLDYRGLTVAAMEELRAELRKYNGSFHVIKNTLAARACEDTPLACFKTALKGPTAITYAGENPVEVAKTLLKFIQGYPSISLKAAVLQGKAINYNEVEELSKLPTKEVLQATLLGLICAPIQALYTVFQENARKVVRVINAKANQAT